MPNPSNSHIATLAPLVADASGIVTLPCELDDSRRRLFVRLAARAA